ncbi:ABC transporter substrate-binding protein [Siccirubricoccus deserti]|uniref:ABC transporter substrate-binding protein n=1 Tax=Siccirubricoccus deserti TaxID=2013562 RepID=A0A9X0R0Y3_9PROT|nr:ABC transporter substrate-binding protein [Siccirubricoccus deserti]MBC4016322.1 ABC transporter substrate-binding protein [Siccirubricoccus deserti]GGC47014.1 ABC transporter substrate-binding protein [Siccirubricoccus deserti]
MLRRRHLLAGGAVLGLARPALGQAPKVLTHVPQASLGSLDPVWTTAVVTRNVATMLFETLYGRDESLDPKPLMLEGHQVADNARHWTMRLREGLVFHDGEKVLARDCVASLRRWMVRDPIGQTIAARLDSLEAPDDRTLVWRLNKPFASLPYALAKTQPSPVIMPARLAATDPYRQVSEIVGSGPFRWVAEEYLPGNRAVFAKSDRYRPRDEPASHCAGGHRVLVDRVEWQFIPDAATAANALINGEVDWIDQPLPDLLPRLRRARGVTVGVIDSYGTFGAIRPNHLHGPTANAGVRRALMAAIDQVEVMTAAMGEDRSLFRAPVGFFLPGTPAANDAGMEVVRQRPGKDRVKAMLAEAGYAGERIVCMHPTDQSFYDAFTSVCVAAWREVGVNVDDQSMDWGTVVQRRTSREPLDKGGWSVFPSGFPAAEYRDPVFATNLRGNGKDAWFGWPEDPEIEAMRDAWMGSTDEQEMRRLDQAIQRRAFQQVPFIPLGQYLPPAAWRSNLRGMLKGPVPVFWNIEKG